MIKFCTLKSGNYRGYYYFLHARDFKQINKEHFENTKAKGTPFMRFFENRNTFSKNIYSLENFPMQKNCPTNRNTGMRLTYDSCFTGKLTAWKQFQNE